MNITLDTNVLNRVIGEENSNCQKIKGYILNGKIAVYVSEASIGLESIKKEDRINKFLRAWAGNLINKTILLPSPEPILIERFKKAFEIGIRVLHVPRVALGNLIGVQPQNWAEDIIYSQIERQERYGKFIADFRNNGLSEPKKLGTELVALYGINCGSFPKEYFWIKGLIAEFDNPRKTKEQKAFVKNIRKLMSEWSDLDIIASHYAYGLDYLCTGDYSKGSGVSGIFAPPSRLKLETDYGIKIMSPEELIKKIEKCAMRNVKTKDRPKLK